MTGAEDTGVYKTERSPTSREVSLKIKKRQIWSQETSLEPAEAIQERKNENRTLSTEF